MLEKNVDIIIIACGTISSNCYNELKEKLLDNSLEEENLLLKKQIEEYKVSVDSIEKEKSELKEITVNLFFIITVE